MATANPGLPDRRNSKYSHPPQPSWQGCIRGRCRAQDHLAGGRFDGVFIPEESPMHERSAPDGHHFTASALNPSECARRKSPPFKPTIWATRPIDVTPLACPAIHVGSSPPNLAFVPRSHEHNATPSKARRSAGIFMGAQCRLMASLSDPARGRAWIATGTRWLASLQRRVRRHWVV